MSTKIVVSNLGATTKTIAYSKPVRGTCGSTMRRNHLEFFYAAALKHADGQTSMIGFSSRANFDRLAPEEMFAEMKAAAEVCDVKRTWKSARVQRFFSLDQSAKWIEATISAEVIAGRAKEIPAQTGKAA